MGIFDKFKKNIESTKPSAKKQEVKEVEKKVSKKIEKDKKADKVQEKSKPVKQETSKQAKKIKYEHAYKVLLRPVVSEKATMLAAQNSYVFEVATKMNKIEIKKAIISVYGVEPVNVNVINVRGRKVRYGKTQGRTKAWKKAIVTLKQGETIKIYEGV